MHEECSMEHPYKPHPTDCHLFYQCSVGIDGNEFVEKSCGQNMFYNSQIQNCDWPANVILLRPECSLITAETESTIDTNMQTKTTIITTINRNVSRTHRQYCFNNPTNVF